MNKENPNKKEIDQAWKDYQGKAKIWLDILPLKWEIDGEEITAKENMREAYGRYSELLNNSKEGKK